MVMLAYFVLTFAVSWSLWLASGVASPAGPHGPLFLLGVFAPGIIALGFTAREGGRDAVTSLLKRLVDWHLQARWYVFAISYMAAIKLTGALLYRAAYGTWPRFGTEPWYILVVATLSSFLLFGQAGEEVGWRGYALPRIAERFGLRAASILVGVVWALWHLPLFLASTGDTFHQSFPLYLFQLTALSVAFAWLYSNTRGSLVPVMLLHAAVNNTKDIVPSADPHATNMWALSPMPIAWITVGLLWLCAAYFLLRMPALNPRQAPDEYLQA